MQSGIVLKGGQLAWSYNVGNHYGLIWLWKLPLDYVQKVNITNADSKTSTRFYNLHTNVRSKTNLEADRWFFSAGCLHLCYTLILLSAVAVLSNEVPGCADELGHPVLTSISPGWLHWEGPPSQCMADFSSFCLKVPGEMVKTTKRVLVLWNLVFFSWV